MFQAVLENRKTFEVRKADRDFKEGDILELVEYDPTTSPGTYSGREMDVMVGFVLPGGEFGIASDYCVLSIKVVAK
jgi:ParB family chromosome partitioning protein